MYLRYSEPLTAFMTTVMYFSKHIKLNDGSLCMLLKSFQRQTSNKQTNREIDKEPNCDSNLSMTPGVDLFWVPQCDIIVLPNRRSENQNLTTNEWYTDDCLLKIEVDFTCFKQHTSGQEIIGITACNARLIFLDS